MIRVGTNVRFLSTVESEQPLRVGDRLGAVLPALSASGGKALLAELDAAALRRLFQGLSDDSGFAALSIELERVRQYGYASNLEGTEDGVSAIGTAIRGRNGAMAGISVALPSSRWKEAAVDAVVAAVLDSRTQIESDLVLLPPG